MLCYHLGNWLLCSSQHRKTRVLAVLWRHTSWGTQQLEQRIAETEQKISRLKISTHNFKNGYGDTLSSTVLSVHMKRGKHTGEKSQRVFPVKTSNLQPEENKEVMKPAVSVIHEVSSLGIESLPSLLSCCFQSHAEGNRSHSSKWFWPKVGNSLGPLGPQLQPLCEQQTHHSSTLTALQTLLQPGHHPIPTQYFGKWGIIEHTPIAQSTSTAGEELGPLPTQLCLGCVLLSICLPPASGFLQDGSSRPFSHCHVISKEAYACFLVFSFFFLTPQVFHWF